MRTSSGSVWINIRHLWLEIAGLEIVGLEIVGLAIAGLALASCGVEGANHQETPEIDASSVDVSSIEDGWLEERLRASGLFDDLLADPTTHRLQILVSEVIADGPVPRLDRHGYRIDREYFYPASAIKTCAAIAAPATLRELSRDHGFPINLHSPLVYHPLFDDEELEELDSSYLSGDGPITVFRETRKLFLVSDNRAYNRLYELVGNEALNKAMWSAGLSSVRLHHRLSEFRSSSDQLRTPMIDLIVDDKRATTVPVRTSSLVLDNAARFAGLEIGVGYASGNETVAGPMSFRRKNAISIVDLQDLNVMLLRPEIELRKPGFDLTPAEQSWLSEVMAEYPSESTDPLYSAEDYPKSWGKYLLPGLARVVDPDQLRIHGKVGRAYGFSVENALVVDTKTAREFFVTAVIYTNANEILNDGIYEYDGIAAPFFADLGEVLARSLLLPGR